MKRKIFFIILGALLILALSIFLWFWFFGRDKSDILPNTGSFDSAGDANGGSGGTGGGGNGQAPIGSNTGTGSSGTGTGGNSSSGTGGSSGSSTSSTPGSQPGTPSSPISSGGSSGSFIPYTSPAGAVWFDGSTWFSTPATGGTGGGTTTTIGGGGTTGGGTNGNGFNFNQTPINVINGGSVSGTPNITTVTGADGQDISLASGLLVVVGGCILNYTLERLTIAPATTAIDAGVDSIGAFFASIFQISGSTPFTPTFTSDVHTQANTSTETVVQCLTRSLGRLAVQQMTDSTVNWINSGFNGQPAYVQDYGQFFSSVADQAAGEFIQGSGLAFLCSPFKLQIKIAIAQSYANRRSSSAGSCTLSGVVGNIDQFMNGDFSQGGWAGLISFTTVPTNNPFGAYMYAEAQLNGHVLASTQEAASTIQDGFLSATEQYDCKTTTDSDGTVHKYGCKTRVVTPGSAIEASLHTALQGQVDSLQLGDSIDQILGALSNQLVTKLLYSGLSNVSQSNTTPTNTPASQAATLMSSIQTGVSAAQQYANIKQSSIADIQSAQQNLATLANCWALATSTGAATGDQIAQANTGFASTILKITQLQTQVKQHNANITKANSSIAKLQQLQTDLLLATVPADVTTVKTKYQNLQTSGSPYIYTTTDITAASQDRETLQGNLATINQTTNASLLQCQAIGN